MNFTIKLTTIEPGVTLYVDPARIVAMKYIEPAKVKSELIIGVRDNDPPKTMLICEHGVRDLVTESPEQINALIEEMYKQPIMLNEAR